MPVELRKRKAPEPAPAPAPKKTSKVAKAAAKVKEAITGKPAEPVAASSTNGAATATTKAVGKPSVGDEITLDGFGGEVETNDGKKTTLKALVEESKGGVVLFTYPKASTPGCTKQACFFRDAYTPLTATGLSIYGLSTDSPKANTSFKEKQKLPYPLLCDPFGKLIAAIGLKKSPSGTQRGVFAIDKAGKVLLAEPGSPNGTVEAVQKLVDGISGPAPAAATEPATEEAPIETHGLNGAADGVKEKETVADGADGPKKE